MTQASADRDATEHTFGAGGAAASRAAIVWTAPVPGADELAGSDDAHATPRTLIICCLDPDDVRRARTAVALSAGGHWVCSVRREADALRVLAQTPFDVLLIGASGPCNSEFIDALRRSPMAHVQSLQVACLALARVDASALYACGADKVLSFYLSDTQLGAELLSMFAADQPAAEPAQGESGIFQQDQASAGEVSNEFGAEPMALDQAGGGPDAVASAEAMAFPPLDGALAAMSDDTRMDFGWLGTGLDKPIAERDARVEARGDSLAAPTSGDEIRIRIDTQTHQEPTSAEPSRRGEKAAYAGTRPIVEKIKQWGAPEHAGQWLSAVARGGANFGGVRLSSLPVVTLLAVLAALLVSLWHHLF